jgi:hypothetical protein
LFARVRCSHPTLLRSDQFGNADQVVGDQIEEEIGGDATDAAMFGLAHGPVLLAPTEDALGHRPTRLRHAVARMPRGSFVDSAVAGLAGFGDGIVLRHMRCHVDGAKIGDMIGRIIRLTTLRAAGPFLPDKTGFPSETVPCPACWSE